MADNTTEDAKVFKNNGKISIPKQLRDFSGARFILIDKIEGKGKKPKQRKWTTEKNYPATEAILLGHIRGGGNYGIATGLGWLHCFDADEYERLKELGIIAKLPQTLTIRTGRTSSEGRHYWYLIEGMQKRIVFFDQELRDPDNEEEFLHLGEVQSKGNYAIGPNSIHISGKKYEIIDDSPIATLKYEDLIEILKPLRLKKKDDRPKETYRNGCEQHSHSEVDIERVAWPTGDVQKRIGTNGTEFVGSHPKHGSKTGKNFSINPSKGIWHCFRCESGGGWVELLAVMEGIISCEQAGKNCLSKKQYREVMQRAEELGLIEENIVDAPIAEVQMPREELVSIPRRAPDGDMVVLVAPPRTGKTHSVVQWLADAGNGNYITHNHAIVEHAIKIAKELGMRGVVWVIGMNQPGACIYSGERKCSECALKHGKDNHFELISAATKLLKEKEVLTAKDIPKNYCPYYILKIAEQHANYCFTVVNNINSIVPRKMVILDEEPTLSHFYATSIEIASVRNRPGKNRSDNFILQSDKLQHELKMILKEGKKRNLKEYAEIINKLSEMIVSLEENNNNIDNLEIEMEGLLKTFEPKHREVREEGNQSEGDDLSLETCIRCLGHLYKECPISIVNKAGGYRSIYILGDERKTNYAMDWLKFTEKVIIIGATKAELFAKEFGGRVIEIKDFRYNDRFMILGIEKDKGIESDSRGKKKAEKKKILEIINAIWENSEKNKRNSLLVLTGSKREQRNVVERIQGATAIRNERENGMQWEMLSGKPLVMYQNSVISRGLDVDQINTMIVYGCDFAQPFWKVADPGIASAIISDETTNSVLRISSTLRNDEKTLKLVVMPESDVRKVKYLSDKTKINEKADTVAKMIIKLGVSSRIEKTGRLETKITSTGIESFRGKEKFYEIKSSVGDMVDDKEKESVMEQILKFMRDQRRCKKKMVNSSKILHELGKRCSKNLVISAMQELYAMGEIRMETHGMEKKWSLKVSKIEDNRKS